MKRIFAALVGLLTMAATGAQAQGTPVGCTAFSGFPLTINLGQRVGALIVGSESVACANAKIMAATNALNARTPSMLSAAGRKAVEQGDASDLSVTTGRVPAGQALSSWLTKPALNEIVPPPFPFATSRVVFGSNPDNQTSWSKLTGKNPIGLLSDVGGYGDPLFTVVPIPEAITGAINIPSTGNNAAHGAGVAGYSRTAAANMGAVGVYGQGDVAATNSIAWGFNTRSIDNGFAGNLWGYEVDINASNAGTFARGIDIVGGSTVQFDTASPAIIVQTPGLRAPVEVRWGRGLFLADGSAISGIEIGAAHASQNGAPGLINSANSGSMPIDLYYRNASDARTKGGTVDVRTDGALRFAAGQAAGLVKLQSRDGGGTLTDNVTLYSTNTGIGNLPGLPGYPLDVAGSSRFQGAVGFNNATPTGKCTLSAAATDAASTMALVNSIRTCLITNGLAQ